MLDLIFLLAVAYFIYSAVQENSENKKTKQNSSKNSNSSYNDKSYSKAKKNENRLAGDIIKTRVAGVTCNNRQQLVKNLQPGQMLKLKREPYNQHDKNAIAVYQKDKQIGYIKKELAINLAPYLDNNGGYRCEVNKVLGGPPRNYGVSIRINL